MSRVARWKAELARYGWVGLGVHYVGGALFLVTIYVLLSMGFQDRIPFLAEHIGEDAALLAGSYAAYKALMVPRLAVTVALTPLVARVVRRPTGEGQGEPG